MGKSEINHMGVNCGVSRKSNRCSESHLHPPRLEKDAVLSILSGEKGLRSLAGVVVSDVEKRGTK